MPVCKKCQNAASTRWNKAHWVYKETKMLETSETKRCTACGALKPLSSFHKKKGGRKGVIANCKDCWSTKCREYDLKNSERVDAYKRKWCLSHKEYGRLNTSNRRARIRLLVGNGISRKEWAALQEDYCGRCAYCGKYAKLEIDHVIPANAGGSHDLSNFVPACRSCNAKKSDYPLLIFMWRANVSML